MRRYGNALTRKGYGRIYVQEEAHIKLVEDILKQIDSSEMAGYYPKGLVAVYTDYPEIIYLHKFEEICMDQLCAICWKKGIPVWVLDNGSVDWAEDLTVEKVVE